mmetsp:Transcript_135244/g.432348  ORF Transcript_135244/g.432348 Transcript_135244/m.432348 type:complete len:368 (-) Transcript_135244:99-1202(-)
MSSAVAVEAVALVVEAAPVRLHRRPQAAPRHPLALAVDETGAVPAGFHLRAPEQGQRDGELVAHEGWELVGRGECLQELVRKQTRIRGHGREFDRGGHWVQHRERRLRRYVQGRKEERQNSPGREERCRQDRAAGRLLGGPGCQGAPSLFLRCDSRHGPGGFQHRLDAQEPRLGLRLRVAEVVVAEPILDQRRALFEVTSNAKQFQVFHDEPHKLGEAHDVAAGGVLEVRDRGLGKGLGEDLDLCTYRAEVNEEDTFQGPSIHGFDLARNSTLLEKAGNGRQHLSRLGTQLDNPACSNWRLAQPMWGEGLGRRAEVTKRRGGHAHLLQPAEGVLLVLVLDLDSPLIGWAKDAQPRRNGASNCSTVII